ncbi:MAG: hypothetical protein V2A71_08180 [Candidatus Eisenbacteria bacterium]
MRHLRNLLISCLSGVLLLPLFCGVSGPLLGLLGGTSQPFLGPISGPAAERLEAILSTPSAFASQDSPGIVFLERDDVDLDGDGRLDYLTVVCFGKPGAHAEYHGFVVAVNGMTIEGSGSYLDGKIEIVDIDSTDKFKEIAIPESGPSDDYGVHVVRYAGRVPAILGHVPGALYWNNEVVFDGSGVVKGSCRGRILDTWFSRCEFRLGESGQLVSIPKDLYEMNRRVKLKVDLPIQKSRSDTTRVAVLREGDSAVILQTDNEKWCLIEGKGGTKGWFEVENYVTVRGRQADEVFDGLVHAD